MGTTIAVSMETKEILRQHGEKGESYDHILQRLLDGMNWKAMDRRWNKILEKDKFIALDEL